METDRGLLEEEKYMGKNRKSLVLWIVGAVFVAVLICISIFFLMPGSNNNRYEGRGKGSSEDAALSFAKAMSKWDCEGMMSACAIESFAENYRRDKMLERDSIMFTEMHYPIPAVSDDDFSRDIMIESIRSDFDNVLFYLYRETYGVNSPISEAFSQSVSARSGEFDEMVQNLKDNLKYIKDTKIDVIGVYGSIPIKNDDMDKCFKMIKQYYCEAWGTDDYDVCGVEIEVDNTEYVLFVGTVNYGGRWYVSGIANIDQVSEYLFKSDEYSKVMNYNNLIGLIKKEEL